MPSTTRLWETGQALQWWETAICQWQYLRPLDYQGKPCSGERQQSVSGNTLDHSTIRASPAVVRDSNLSVAMPSTTQLSGQVLQWWETAISQWQCLRPLSCQGKSCSGERQQSVSGNAFDHSAVRASPAVVRDSNLSVAMPSTTRLSGQALQWWETAISQWQCLRPLGYQGKSCSGERQQSVSGNALDHSAIRASPAVVRDSNLSVAIP